MRYFFLIWVLVVSATFTVHGQDYKALQEQAEKHAENYAFDKAIATAEQALAAAT